MSWNAVAQPIVVNGVSATYDALGRMVEAGSGTTYVQVVFRPSGDKLAIVQNGVLSKGTVPLPGGASAIYNASGLSYIRHKDWLGSSRLATTWNHAVYAKEAYAPFGETYNEAGTADRSFTGQDQDTTQGIYDFLCRRYDQSAGRWMSPDPSGWSAVKLTSPQSLNRYAYALNNPLGLTDPTGLYTRGDSCNGTVYSAVCEWILVIEIGNIPTDGSNLGLVSYVGGDGGGTAPINLTRLIANAQNNLPKACDQAFASSISKYTNANFFNQLLINPIVQIPNPTSLRDPSTAMMP